MSALCGNSWTRMRALPSRTAMAFRLQYRTAGAPTSYYDLWRVENGKIAEHWDVMETIAEKSTWANQNGKF